MVIVHEVITSVSRLLLMEDKADEGHPPLTSRFLSLAEEHLQSSAHPFLSDRIQLSQRISIWKEGRKCRPGYWGVSQLCALTQRVIPWHKSNPLSSWSQPAHHPGCHRRIVGGAQEPAWVGALPTLHTQSTLLTWTMKSKIATVTLCKKRRVWELCSPYKKGRLGFVSSHTFPPEPTLSHQEGSWLQVRSKQMVERSVCRQVETKHKWELGVWGRWWNWHTFLINS